jgi:hypothetical protein
MLAGLLRETSTASCKLYGTLDGMKSFIPSQLWSIVSLLCLAGWILTVVCVTRYGFRPDGSFSGKQSFIWLALFIILYIMWIFGLSNL